MEINDHVMVRWDCLAYNDELFRDSIGQIKKIYKKGDDNLCTLEFDNGSEADFYEQDLLLVNFNTAKKIKSMRNRIVLLESKVSKLIEEIQK